MRVAGASQRWRINIPGTSPRPPAHAEENITAISGGNSACTQYLDGEFGVINLALSSSLRGPWGSGMFGMGKKLESVEILRGALWGSARAAAVPGAGCRPLMAPGRANHPAFVTIGRLPADKSVLGSQSQPTPDLFSPFASYIKRHRPMFELWLQCTECHFSEPQFLHLQNGTRDSCPAISGKNNDEYSRFVEEETESVSIGTAKRWKLCRYWGLLVMRACMCFPGGISGKEPACQCRRHGFDPSVGKIPCRRKWQPTPYLENPMDRGAWWAAVHRVTKSQTRQQLN